MRWTCAIGATALMICAAASAAEQTVVRFKEIDTLFANPGKGWMAGGRGYAREPRLPTRVAYVRYNWCDLEPEEGRYQWKLIDDAINGWAKREGRVAVRIMTTNAHSATYYCSPKWLFGAGCRFYEYDRGGGDPTSGGKAIKRIEPDYADPIYLARHAAFLAALGKRYDGHPGIEFIDIGSYGIWGEWHTPNGKPWETRRRIIDMYLDSFKQTHLMQMSDDAEAMAYALPRGAGYRRDGVGSPWHEERWIGHEKYAKVPEFAEQWKKAPVVFEWFGNYEYLQGRKWSFDRAVEFMLKNHVTYINDNIGNVPKDQWPQVEKLARLSGYRFVLREAAHPAAVARGQKLTMSMKWSNVGVGKLYRRHALALYLLDSAGKAVLTTPQDDVDPTTWLPGDHAVAATLIPPAGMKPGEYGLGVALIDPQTGRPAIRLAIDVPETGRLHTVSRVSVE